LSYLPAIGMGHLGNQTVGMQQAQPPGNLGRLRALLFGALGFSKEQNADLAVAKTFQSPFAPVNGRQQLRIGCLKGIERPVAALVPTQRLTDLDGFLGQWSSDAGGSQRAQIPFIGRLGDLRSPKFSAVNFGSISALFPIYMPPERIWRWLFPNGASN